MAVKNTLKYFLQLATNNINSGGESINLLGIWN